MKGLRIVHWGSFITLWLKGTPAPFLRSACGSACSRRASALQQAGAARRGKAHGVADMLDWPKRRRHDSRPRSQGPRALWCRSREGEGGRAQGVLCLRRHCTTLPCLAGGSFIRCVRRPGRQSPHGISKGKTGTPCAEDTQNTSIPNTTSIPRHSNSTKFNEARPKLMRCLRAVGGGEVGLNKGAAKVRRTATHLALVGQAGYIGEETQPKEKYGIDDIEWT